MPLRTHDPTHKAALAVLDVAHKMHSKGNFFRLRPSEARCALLCVKHVGCMYDGSCMDGILGACSNSFIHASQLSSVPSIIDVNDSMDSTHVHSFVRFVSDGLCLLERL